MTRHQTTRLRLLGTGLLLAAILGTGCQQTDPAASPVTSQGARPNIILIMTDDQGYGDLGVTGNPLINTPHIDALASRSAHLSDFYVSPVCAPTRASLMTGRYNYRTRVVDTFKGRAMMDPQEITLAETLRQAGYKTGIFGKWHLGDCYPVRPQDQGFDEALVHRGGGLAQPSEPIANQRRYTDSILLHNGEEVTTQGYCTDVYFEAAMKFIDQAQDQGSPFFVYIPPNAPHDPFHDVPEELYQKYKQMDLSPVLGERVQDTDKVARTFAMIENIDQNVGRLQSKLDAMDLTENTIVIFMVDNGPLTRRYNGPFRGTKTGVHEGGIRSPFYIQWPARLKPGLSSDRITAHIDVMPTLLDAANIPLPAHVTLDGRSFLPLLEGRKSPWPDRHIVIQSHRGDTPVRYHHFAIRNQQWKLVHPTGFGRETPPTDVPFELYDISQDLGESHNLASERPEVLARLKTAYDAWFDDVSHTRPNNYDPPRIVVGTDHETRTVLTWEDWRVPGSSGWGHLGTWWLRFESEQSYDIELLWPQAIDPCTIELSVGNLQKSKEMTQTASRTVFNNLTIPPGKASLQVKVLRNGEVKDPYHVILHRR